MCQESLINYLNSELNEKVKLEEIEEFVRFADSFLEHEIVAFEKTEKVKRREIKETKNEHEIPETIIAYGEIIDSLLANIKICDPSVGSGAFPVGMLHEIVKLRQLLSLYLKKDINTYDLKRNAIENSLYCVDIDPGAIEICKLRFWLSLVVDEDDFHNIKPLPNLDYKVMCGNSLFGLPENILANAEINSEIEQNKKILFSTTSTVEKNKIRNEIEDLFKKQIKFIQKIDHHIGEINFDFRLHFSEVFRRKDWEKKNGFDVVIANPPYVRQERIKCLKPQLEKHYKDFYNSTSDLYTYFYRKSYDILQGNGILCFISSNKWMRAKYGEKLRNFIKNNTKILKLIDFGGYPVFEQTVDTNIILFQKSKSDENHLAKFVNVGKVAEKDNVIEYIRSNQGKIPQKKLSDNAWTLADQKVLLLKEKIEKTGKPLKDWDVKIYFGIKTGFNEAFIIDTETRNRILTNCRTKEERKRTEEIIKPVLRGRDIDKYYYNWAGLWVICTFPSKGIDINKYSALKEYLASFGKRLLQDGKPGHRKKTLNQWFETQDNIAYYSEFEKEKIVWNRITDKIIFSFVNPGFYVLDSTFIITGKDLKYLIGLLNSKIIAWWIKLSAATLGEGSYGAKIYIEKSPIPLLTHRNQPITDQIITLVDQILSAKKQNPDTETSQLETQIDQLVYKLYNLNEDEIKIIEGEKE